MSSTVCCLEPLVLEPRSLMHQMAPSKQDLSFPWPQKPNETTPASENQNNFPISKPIDGWNLIQPLTSKQSEPFVYVHPLVKHSSSSLSTKSLQMCTENLGSETGTDAGIDSSFDAFSYLLSDRKQSSTPKTCNKKVKQSKSFPPPLTSISGSDGVQMKTHREEGRLVIKAFTFSSRKTYFRAERENGRLRLSFIMGNGEDDEEENLEENKDSDGVESVHLKGCVWGENKKDDGKNVDCKLGSGEWSSSNRCYGDRGGGKRIPSLPFCVAIS